MGLFDRVEHKLESVVNGVFARAFKAEVQPVEIASAMRGAMDDRAAVVAHGRTIVPNAFTIDLASSDYERLHQYDDVLRTELVASVQEHAESQGYTPGGPLFVELVERDDLDTGVFRVHPTSTRDPRPSKAGARGGRNEFLVPQARAAAAGPVGLAGNAATAAAAAAAGTAAARRATETPVPRHSERDDAARARQRAQDLAAWPADPHEAHEEPRPNHSDDLWPSDPDDSPATAAAPVLPSRAVARRPWLELEHDSYPLLTAITVIGRDSAADITLEDSGISRRHCEIRVTHDGPHLVISVRDLGSTNGTFVNGERMTTSRLVEGDRLTVGRSNLTLRLGDR